MPVIKDRGSPEVDAVPALSPTAGKTSFVIMPFGLKEEIDFDRVYEVLIRPVLTKLQLRSIRADEINKAGLIHKDMIERIIGSDVVVVDITTLNPNVFYELGIRHMAKRSGTILVRQTGSRIPFNITGMTVFEYDLSIEAGVELARSAVEAGIRNSLEERNIDSLVHTLVPGLRVSKRASAISERRIMDYASPSYPGKVVGIITGDIVNVDTVDVWVNAENTKLEMARTHDDSISAIIRYFGAKRDKAGRITEDTIVDAIRRRMGSGAVEPGTVFHTGAGQLWQNNRVKAVVHIAAMHGEPGKGYLPVRNSERCVTTALNYIASLNRRFWRSSRLKSVLIPLFGSRTSADHQDTTVALFAAALTHFNMVPDSLIERIYFLAFTDHDYELCDVAVARLGLTKK